jgi:hypothetical protein
MHSNSSKILFLPHLRKTLALLHYVIIRERRLRAKSKFIIVNLIIWSRSGFTQIPAIVWEKELEIPSNHYFADAIELAQGNFIIAGAIEMEGDRSYDLWLLEVNPSGDTLRNTIIENRGNDIPLRIISKKQDGFLIASVVLSSDNTSVARLTAVDNNFSVKWVIDAGQPSTIYRSDVTYGNNRDIWWLNSFPGQEGQNGINLCKINSEGSKLAEFSFYEGLPLYGYTLRNLPDGTLGIICQVKPKEGNPTIRIIKVGAEGKLIWKTTIPQSEKILTPQCMCCLPDNSMLAGGWSGLCYNPDAAPEEQIWDNDYLLTRINQNGKIIWIQQYSREGSEKGTAVVSLPGGNILAAGKCETSFTGTVGLWLLLVDKNGEIIKDQVLKFKFADDQVAQIICTSDDGLLMIGPGYVKSDHPISGWIRKLNESSAIR